MVNQILVNVFLYICNNNGEINSVVNALGENHTFQKGEKIFDKVLPESKAIWETSFIDSEDDQNEKNWIGFLTRVNGVNYACFLATLGNQQIMVLGMKENVQHFLYEEIIKINGQLTNKIRSLYKEKAAPNLDAYEEISKMNNELANARRELKKKNNELQQLNLQLEQLAIKDALTDLFNRRYFHSFIQDVAHRAKRLKLISSIILIDINGFKSVNDHFGHDVGDQLLVHLSKCLKDTFRSGQDTVFRFGGDEFLILLEASNYSDSILAMNRLNHLYAEDSKGTSLAAGIVEIDHEVITEDFAEVLKNADDLMYLEKKRMKKSEFA